MRQTELAGVTALGEGELASVAGGVDWSKFVMFLYGEVDSIWDGVKAGYAAAG